MALKNIFLLVFFLFISHFSFAQKNQPPVYFSEKAFQLKLTAAAKQIFADKSINRTLAIREQAAHLKDNAATAAFPGLLISKQGKKLDGENLYDKCKGGVFTVAGGYEEKAIRLATAFAITDDGICVTNYHVMKNLIIPNEDREEDRLALGLNVFICSTDGKYYPVERIIAYSTQADIAIFKVNTRGEKLLPLPLGQPAKIGDFAAAITNPNGLTSYYSQGAVAQNTQNSEGLSGRMQITADYAKGSSGGPILNAYGEVIGMVSTTSPIYYNQQKQQNLQMVIKSTIPVASIHKLL